MVEGVSVGEDDLTDGSNDDGLEVASATDGVEVASATNGGEVAAAAIDGGKVAAATTDCAFCAFFLCSLFFCCFSAFVGICARAGAREVVGSSDTVGEYVGQRVVGVGK